MFANKALNPTKLFNLLVFMFFREFDQITQISEILSGKFYLHISMALLHECECG